VVIRNLLCTFQKEEQKKCFIEGFEGPQEDWKFSMADVKGTRFLDDYHDAYEEMSGIPREDAPVRRPADNKWFTR